MGLFHIQMNIVKLMIMTYCGRPDAPSIPATVFVTARGRVISDGVERRLLWFKGVRQLRASDNDEQGGGYSRR